jgi:Flp pilus assembly protein TadG
MTKEKACRMMREIVSFFRRLRSDESGAVAVLVAISIVALIGLTGLALDIGNMVYAQRRLQATTDMAAFAGAQFIVSGKAIAVADQYSAVNGVGNNTINGLTVTMVSGYPQLICDPNITNIVSCAGPTTQCTAPGCNTIVVKQQASVPLIFAKWFGINSVQLSATSFAARGGGFPPMHIMIVLDNTDSMNNQDGTGATCGGFKNPTRIQCALAGIQILLAELWPTQDEVGLIVFPPVSSSTASNDANCSTSSTITPEPYACYQNTTGKCPATGTVYQIVPLSSSYKASNTSTNLTNPTTGSCTNPTSCPAMLVNATCAKNSSIDQNGVTSKCSSCQGDKVVGNEGTYLAGAIAEAQAALGTPPAGVQNVIIVLSDGGAGNTVGTAQTSGTTPAGGRTLTFPATGAGSLALATPPLVVNSIVCDSNPVAEQIAPPSCPNGGGTSALFAANTVVTAITSTTVTLSNPVKKSIGIGTTIYFGGYNQCNTSVQAAQAAAAQGTWVYAIAYGSYTQNSPNANSCFDIENPPISSCTTMGEGEPGTHGIASDPTKFYSDPMNVSPACVSPDNPTATDIATIFQDIAASFIYTQLLPISLQ